MVLARSGQVNIDVAAGAIIAGAYFGDRCSPMSSNANWVAALTQPQLKLIVLFTGTGLLADIEQICETLSHKMGALQPNLGRHVDVSADAAGL